MEHFLSDKQLNKLFLKKKSTLSKIVSIISFNVKSPLI
jgi:hypothetical protein